VRVIVVLLVCVGCGRIAFDPLTFDSLADAPVTDAVDCPASYTFSGASCYRLVAGAGALAWLGAEQACEADGSGAHLVVLDDLAEVQVVRQFVPTTIVDHWIGTTDFVTEGVYLGVTNQPAQYLVWGPTEPDGSADCVRLSANNQLTDDDCLNDDDFVCEYDGVAAVPAAYGQ
jgi:hypothetical protein